MGQPGAGQFQSVTTDELEFTIEDGEVLSQAVDLEGTFLVGLVMPADFDGTQLRFQGSRDGTTFVPLYNTSGILLTATVPAATAAGISIVPSDFAMWRYLKLEAVTPQTGDTVIGAVTRPLS